MSLAPAVELRWKAAPGAAAYRFFLREVGASDFEIRATVRCPIYFVPSECIRPDRTYRWKVEQSGDGARWSPWIGYLPIRPPGDAALATTVEWSAPEREPLLYRFIVRDESSASIVARHLVTTNRIVIDWAGLNQAHDYRYRVQIQEGGEWRTWVDYQELQPPLPAADVISVAAQLRCALDDTEALDEPMQILANDTLALARPGVPAGRKADVLFLFTVDTEVNIRRMREPAQGMGVDHQIYGRIGNQEYGIGLIMDALERCGLRGTFFLDVLMEYQFGEDALKRIVEFIRVRGHDIQLHLHTSPHLWWAGDPKLQRLIMAEREDNSITPFREALELSIELFERRVGYRPTAFRNGSYRIRDSFFPVLRDCGIAIDSTIYAFKNCAASPWLKARTQPFEVDGVLEVPVSWMIYENDAAVIQRQFTIRGPQPAFTQPLTALLAPIGDVPRTVVYMSHSYTLLKETRSMEQSLRDNWNARLRTFTSPEAYKQLYLDANTPMVFFEGPDQRRISVLFRNLEAVASTKGVRALTFRELHDEYLAVFRRSHSAADPVPRYDALTRQGSLAFARRYSESFLDRLETSAAGASG